MTEPGAGRLGLGGWAVPRGGGAVDVFRSLLRMNLVIMARNRQLLVFNFLVPLMMILIFGGLFQGRPTQVAVAGPPALVQVLHRALPRHSYHLTVLSAAGARRAVAGGRDDFAVVIPGAATAGASRRVSVVLNAANVSNNGAFTAAAEAAVAAVNQALLRTAPAAVPVVSTVQPRGSTRTGSQASSNYIQYLTPGVVAYAVLVAGLLGAGARMVADRQRGTLRRLRAAPVPTWLFLLAQIASQLVLVAVQVVVLLGAAHLVYGVGIGSDPLGLALVLFLGSLCFVAFGFVVAGIAHDDRAAITIGNLFSLPQLFMAGIFFPISASPLWLQRLALFMPLRYFSDGLRSLMSEGRPLGAVTIDLAVLAGCGLLALVVATRTFRFDPVGTGR